MHKQFILLVSNSLFIKLFYQTKKKLEPPVQYSDPGPPLHRLDSSMSLCEWCSPAYDDVLPLEMQTVFPMGDKEVF
jgi:hypothetical protein